jgi:non-heme chloroperoxidase
MAPSQPFSRLFAFGGLLVVLSLTIAGQAEWKDPARHVARLVDVEPGVTLEVLDWGGSGAPVLLLAGHGDTAHVFDDFALELGQRFRILAVTRRGFGASSQPEQGYDLTRLVHDIARVAEILNLKHVHLIGHSIAGDEMTRLARTRPDMVRTLVYLDAAYDRVEAQRVESTFPKIPPPPAAAQESGSVEAVRALIARTEILLPESEIRATRVFGADGYLLRPVTPDRILRKVAAMVQHPDYSSLRVPMLSIFAVANTPAQLVPRYSIADTETRQALKKVFEIWQPFAKFQRELFRKSVPHARVVEISDANHRVFISDREHVLREIRAFLPSH